MRKDNYIGDNLNPQANTLINAQTDIKTAIKKGVLGSRALTVIKAEIQRIIDKALSRIRSPT